MNIKNKILFEINLKDNIKHEKTNEATSLKYKLIMELINNEIKYIDIFNYYYDIIELNKK